MRTTRVLLVLSSALVFVACGGGRKMRERSVNSAPNGSVASAATPTGALAQTPARVTSVPTVAAPVTITETQPTTPKSYAAAAPQKPKITGLSEDELKKCESVLPTLDSCKPSKTIAEGQAAVINEVRACVARYVAELDGCLCQAGSKAHCQFAEDQKREIGKMTP